MRFLFVLRQKKNLDTFVGVIRELLQRGHEVRLAVQDRGDLPDKTLGDLAELSGLTVVTCLVTRGDDWAYVAPLIRSFRDYFRYLSPQLQPAAKLRSRALTKLHQTSCSRVRA